MRRVLFALVSILQLTFAFVPANADIYIEDGLSHTIDDGTYAINILHFDKNTANQPGTHIDIVENGIVNAVEMHNYSTANISGGRIHSLLADGNNNMSLSAGEIQFLRMYGSSSFSMSGGVINGNCSFYGASSVTVAGGRIGETLYVNDNSAANISSGLIGKDIQVFDNSSIWFSGGQVQKILWAVENGTIYLVGNDFSVTNLNGITTALSYGDRLSDYASFVNQPIGLEDYYTGTINGILSDGSVLTNRFYLMTFGSHAGTGDIIIVPEPGTMGLLAVGAVAMVRKRRQKN